jgi:predicted nucleic acid-binding protein
VRLMLDSNILGYICHPRKHPEVRAWFKTLIMQDPPAHEVLIPEIADYELRRELLRIRSTTSLKRLDLLANELTYVPLDTATLRDAPLLWAALRQAGEPTADDQALDADVILAAQALRCDAVVVTENVKHLIRMVQALRWPEV